MIASFSQIKAAVPALVILNAYTFTAVSTVAVDHRDSASTVQGSLDLGLTLPSVVNEGDPDGQGTVTLSSPSSSNVTVQLTSSNTGALTVPANVVVPAGKTSVAFPYVIIDNLSVYGNQTTTVTANATGWVEASQIVTVTDNKTTDNWSSFGNGQTHTGVYRGSLLGGTYSQVWSATFPSTTAALNPVTVAKGIVYVTPITYFGIADLTAVNASTGAQIWQYNYNATGIPYFSINPPTIYKGDVYVQQGSGLPPGGGEIISPELWSFNAYTGQVNWSVEFGAQFERYLAPTVYQSIGIWVDGGEYGGLYGFNFDGSEISFTEEPQCDQWTPTFYDGTIYTWVSTDSAGTGTFKAVNPANGAVLWSLTEPATIYTYDMNCAAPIANDLAFLQGFQSLTAINLKTHAVAWTITGTFTGTPAISNGKVYIISGSLVKILEARNGATLSTVNTYDTGLEGQPVVANDSVIVSSSTNTYLFSLETGALVQTIPYGGPVSVAGGNLYLAGSDGTLRVFESNIADFNFSSSKAVGLTAYGYTATSRTLKIKLKFAPAPGSVLTAVDNTSPAPISGTFTNLPNGGTITAVYKGTSYTFTANYAGGDGNDLTLTYP